MRLVSRDADEVLNPYQVLSARRYRDAPRFMTSRQLAHVGERLVMLLPLGAVLAVVLVLALLGTASAILNLVTPFL